jgi:hypothetical protein
MTYTKSFIRILVTGILAALACSYGHAAVSEVIDENGESTQSVLVKAGGGTSSVVTAH